MPISKKHHYIPIFYLKGFTDSNGQFYIYDKAKDEIRLSSPENSFFEKFSNSATIKDEKSDLAEQILAYFDGRTASYLEKLRSSSFEEQELTVENLYILRLFIATIFWRIPINDKIREEMIDKYSFQDLGFGIFSKESGDRNITFEERMRDLDIFRKICTSILPTVSFIDKYNNKNYDDWKLIHRTNSSHITGDNPIILKGPYKDFSTIQRDLIMPLSSNKIILCTDKKVPSTFQPQFNLLMDTIILHQSKRFVCSSNKDYLELLVERVYKTSLGRGWEKNMIDSLFANFA
jgi:hypothetical protein